MTGLRVLNKGVRLGGTIVGQESDTVVIVKYDGCKLDRREHISNLKIYRHGRKSKK